jgi:hypothetical protein
MSKNFSRKIPEKTKRPAFLLEFSLFRLHRKQTKFRFKSFAKQKGVGFKYESLRNKRWTKFCFDKTENRQNSVLNHCPKEKRNYISYDKMQNKIYIKFNFDEIGNRQTFASNIWRNKMKSEFSNKKGKNSPEPWILYYCLLISSVSLQYDVSRNFVLFCLAWQFRITRNSRNKQFI